MFTLFVVAAAVTTKPIRQGQKAQAGVVSGTASAALATKGHSKKRSRKEIFLSEDESIASDEETSLTIQMRNTISRGTAKDGCNTLEAFKSLFNEVRSRKDLISQLGELDGPSYKDEILTNKRRIIEVSPIFN